MFIQVHYPEEEGIPSKYRGDFTKVKKYEKKRKKIRKKKRETK